MTLSTAPFKLTDEHLMLSRHVKFVSTPDGFKVDPDVPYVLPGFGQLRMDPALAVAMVLNIEPSEDGKYSKVQMDHFAKLHQELAQALPIVLQGNTTPGYYVKVFFEGRDVDEEDFPYIWLQMTSAITEADIFSVVEEYIEEMLER